MLSHALCTFRQQVNSRSGCTRTLSRGPSRSFSRGRDGPKALGESNSSQQDAAACSAPFQSFAQLLGRVCSATTRRPVCNHPIFWFLVSNILLRSSNRRISVVRMTKGSFQRLERVYGSLTTDRLKAAENEMLGRAKKDCTIIQNPGLSNFIACISAIDKALTPLVIYKGQTVQQSWFPDDSHFIDFLNDWDFTCSPKGWTNNIIATIWLKEIFNPQTQRAKKGDKRPYYRWPRESYN